MGISVPARQIVVDHAKLQRMLGSPELAWLVDRIRGRLERGEPIDGTVTLVGATPTQRRAAARLLGRNVGRGTSLSVPLPAVAAELWRRRPHRTWSRLSRLSAVRSATWRQSAPPT